MPQDFVKVSLKGQDFTFTALDFGQLQVLEADFDALKGLDGGIPNAAQRKAVVNVCTASLQFRHPGVTPEAVASLLTISNINAALMAVAGISMLTTVGQSGEQSGNAQAASPSIG